VEGRRQADGRAREGARGIERAALSYTRAMDPILLVLRVVHVVGGVFWAGAILFVVHFLEPAVRDAGPDGARVMQALQKRRYLDVMPVVAVGDRPVGRVDDGDEGLRHVVLERLGHLLHGLPHLG
jgi:hypothetical protein